MKQALLLLGVLAGGMVVLGLALRLPRSAGAPQPAPVAETMPAEASRGPDVADRPGALRRAGKLLPAGRSELAENGMSEPFPRAETVPGEWVFVFFSEADRKAFEQLAVAYGFEPAGRLTAGHALRLRGGSRAALEALLNAAPAPVAYGPNFVVRVPTPPDLEQRRPEGSYTAFGMRALDWLGTPREHGVWGEGVLVAVLDTAVAPHPALSGSGLAQLVLVLDEGVEGAVGAGHGTAVASLIGGNGIGVQGVAPASRLLSLAVMTNDGQGDTFTLARGIVESVERGAQVLNISLGTYGDCVVLQRAVAYALEQGVAVVAAAGNDGVAAVQYPAAYGGVLAVAAVDASGRHMYFANRGDVALAAPGLGVAAADVNGQLQAFSGTSAAAPLVSGALAGLLSSDPSMTPQEAVALLLETANDAGRPGFDEEYGHGILNVRRAVQRGTPGIYDVGVGDLYVADPSVAADLTATVYVQNRGTEPLPAVEMDVNVDGVNSRLHFHDIGVGDTAQAHITIPEAHLRQYGEARLRYEARIVGRNDAFPGDNAREVMFRVARD